MEDLENINQAETSATEPDTGAYISAIKDIKANSVSLSEYNKMKQERDDLLNSIVQGNANFKEEEIKEEPVDVDALRNKIFNSESISNLEYIDSSLKLRKELMNRGEPDIFVPHGSQYSPESEDYIKADKVATVLQECVDIAAGDSEVFTRELQRRIVDTNIPRRK